MALDCTAEGLMLDAAVLMGIGDGAIDSIITYLLCQWANQ